MKRFRFSLVVGLAYEADLIHITLIIKRCSVANPI